jgi:hypothetical protein
MYASFFSASSSRRLEHTMSLEDAQDLVASESLLAHCPHDRLSLSRLTL